jgi:hypothetical protein
MDNFEPFVSVVLFQAVQRGGEMPEFEPHEVRGDRLINILAVQVDGMQIYAP